MFFWIKKLFTQLVQLYYIVYYKDKSYVVRISKDMGLDINVLYLVKDIQQTIDRYIFQHNAIELPENHQFYNQVMSVVTSTYEAYKE